MKFTKLLLSFLIFSASFQQTNAFDLKKIASENYGKIIGTILLNAVLTKYFYYYDLDKEAKKIAIDKQHIACVYGVPVNVSDTQIKSEIWHKVLPISFLKSSVLTSALLFAVYAAKQHIK